MVNAAGVLLVWPALRVTAVLFLLCSVTCFVLAQHPRTWPIRRRHSGIKVNIICDCDVVRERESCF